jgi:hypothetical protein
MRNSILLTRKNLKNQLISKDYIIVIVVLLAYFSFIYLNSAMNLSEEGLKINVFVPFIYSLFLRDYKLVVYGGLIVMFYDSIQKKNGMMFHMTRMNIREWHMGQTLSMFLEVFIYFAFIGIMTICVYLGNVSVLDGWGKGVDEGAFFSGAFTITEFHIDGNVFVVFGKAFVLAVMLGIVFGAICMLFDNLGRSRFGPAICVILLVWNVIVEKSSTIPDKFSIVGWVEKYAEGSFLLSLVCYFVIAVFLLNLAWILQYKNKACK